jgi:hypothetical protein
MQEQKNLYDVISVVSKQSIEDGNFSIGTAIAPSQNSARDCRQFSLNFLGKIKKEELRNYNPDSHSPALFKNVLENLNIENVSIGSTETSATSDADFGLAFILLGYFGKLAYSHFNDLIKNNKTETKLTSSQAKAAKDVLKKVMDDDDLRRNVAMNITDNIFDSPRLHTFGESLTKATWYRTIFSLNAEEFKSKDKEWHPLNRCVTYITINDFDEALPINPAIKSVVNFLKNFLNDDVSFDSIVLKHMDDFDLSSYNTN